MRRAESQAQRAVSVLLETDSPFSKKQFTLEYRPFKRGDDWRWFWVLHSEAKDTAAAHGEADSRYLAAIDARLKARELGGTIAGVSVAQIPGQEATAG